MFIAGAVAGLGAAPDAFAGDPAGARPKSAPPVGATEVFRFAPTAGFVDDPVTGDGARIAFVVADTAGTAALHVVDPAGKAVGAPIDLAPITVKPIALAFVGDRVLVIGKDTAGAELAGLIDLTGKVIYKTPAVTHAALVTVGGTQRIALHTAAPAKAGTRYTVELRAVDTGKRVGKPKTLDVDAAGKNAKLDFRINHWTTGWTRVVGIKAGTWNKAENQQSPDVEATYDLVTGKFVGTTEIPDVVGQRKRFAVLAEHQGEDVFARMSDDLTAIEVWQGGVPTVVALDQPQIAYGDGRKSLDVRVVGGTTWVALQVDPVNAEAVKRKKADLEYWDLYAVDGGKGVRKARVFAGGTRFRFGFVGDRLWILDRNIGFDRGGKALAVFTLP
jgi:hypothetical protein